MFTIRDATKAFFVLDRIEPEKTASLDKALRNLSQRIYMPPVGREGRADTYSLASICALRLLHKASSFGLERWQLEKLSQFLQIADPLSAGQSESFSDGWRVLSRIEEAVLRVKEGEDFTIGLRMLSDGTVRPFTDWADNRNANEAEIRNAAGLDELPEDARFTIPASRLISELLSELDADS